MIVDRYDPINLFEELVPKLNLKMEPELRELDRLLEDDVLFEQVRADLCQRYPNSARLGRHSTPVEVILRMLVVKRLYGFSYEQTEHFVSDSIVLRQFCRVYLEPAPDDTTLIRWANQIGPETLASLNERAVELAKSLKVTRGRKLRVDSTVVETNVHPPTDSKLLGDGIRVISRLLRRAKRVLSAHDGLPKEVFRTRNCSVRRLSQKLHRIALGKGEKAKEQLRDAYRKLISVAKASRAQAVKVEEVLRKQTDPRAGRLARRLEHFVALLERGIDQAVRRVLEGEQVPAKEKILSLFEPHTQIITRRKIGKPREFGRKILLDEVEGGIISRYELLKDVGREHPHLPESIEAHRKSFGRAPYLLSGDRGLYSVENEKLAHEAGVKRVALPKSGRASKERQRYEKQRWFRRGFRFRAGIEGRISVLRRSYGLGRCLDHGEEGMGRWVGWGIFVHNLSKISKTQAARAVA
ncbi:MAG: ISNCY family transposase [Chloroflexota bacterium]|nr:ISNCY family transposase [Chloroflexota bacterium]